MRDLSLILFTVAKENRATARLRATKVFNGPKLVTIAGAGSFMSLVFLRSVWDDRTHVTVRDRDTQSPLLMIFLTFHGPL